MELTAEAMKLRIITIKSEVDIYFSLLMNTCTNRSLTLNIQLVHDHLVLEQFTS